MEAIKSIKFSFMIVTPIIMKVFCCSVHCPCPLISTHKIVANQYVTTALASYNAPHMRGPVMLLSFPAEFELTRREKRKKQ